MYGFLYFDKTFLYTPSHKELRFSYKTFSCISYGCGCDTCWLTDVIRVERYTRSFYLIAEVGRREVKND